MNSDLTTVLMLLGVCTVCFVINKPRMDIVGILAIIALPLLGLVDFNEAIAGFSDSSIMLIALMFIMGEGLTRTGVSYKIGSWILKKSGNSETRLVIFLMTTVAIIGSVMSSTGIVAIFIPIVMTICGRLKISPSKLMMPLSFAGLISGMMSLVATPPNMILNSTLTREGIDGFKFFDFTPIGAAVLVAGIVYMLYARRFLRNSAPNAELIERKTFASFINDYKLSDKVKIFKIAHDSPSVGKSLKELGLPAGLRLNIACIERGSRFDKQFIDPNGDTVINAGDLVLTYLAADEEAVRKFEDEFKWTNMPLRGPYFKDFSTQMGLAEIAIPPDSKLIGESILSSHFRAQYGASVAGMRHDAVPLEGDIASAKIKMGDILLAVGPWSAIRKFRTRTKDFVVFNLPAEFDNAVAAPGKAIFALISLAVMITLMIGGFVPNTMAAFIGCLLLVIFRCMDMEDAYKSINWPSVILIVGMMPFAIALQKTGGVEIAANWLIYNFSEYGPRAVLAAIFALTALTGLFVSNTITALLLAPIAISAAKLFEMSPYPFAITVAIAASTAFMTPISSPVNTLVWTSGRYKFTDFMKIGIPFSIIVMIISVILIPILFPFKLG